MISQFYILSLRGDTIITRDFRGDVVKGTAEIFFRKVKFWHGDAPPIFNLDGVTYVFIKKNGLYFVATTCHNISPAAVVELLTKMAKVFKDFCGMLNEESIRKNFVLVYELLDEMVDFGYPQTTNTEHLKSCIHNEAVVIEAPKLGLNLPQWNPRTVPSNAVHRPVGPTHDAKNKKNEIFVDILERISVLMSSNGFVINSAIDGSIQMKSYLMGNPELKLALNEDIVVKNMDLGGSHGGYGSVILDDCNFHECVDLQDFSDLRTLSFYPPDGEFAVMNYRITGDFRVPFRIFPFAEQQTPHKLEITIKVRADIPESNYGGNVQISCMLPKTSASVSTELAVTTGQSAEYLASEHRLLWNIKKFQGGTEAAIKCRVTLSAPVSNVQNIKKEVGPVSLTYEIPMYNVSNLQARLATTCRCRENSRGAQQRPRQLPAASCLPTGVQLLAACSRQVRSETTEAPPRHGPPLLSSRSWLRL
ncbi:AP4M [Symbiodinium sp. CCMP2592]|nr:AP4M [Symbiodinium sp. CCMP2592]